MVTFRGLALFPHAHSPHCERHWIKTYAGCVCSRPAAGRRGPPGKLRSHAGRLGPARVSLQPRSGLQPKLDARAAFGAGTVAAWSPR